MLCTQTGGPDSLPSWRKAAQPECSEYNNNFILSHLFILHVKRNSILIPTLTFYSSFSPFSNHARQIQPNINSNINYLFLVANGGEMVWNLSLSPTFTFPFSHLKLGNLLFINFNNVGC